jgi:hypothetical protein
MSYGNAYILRAPSGYAGQVSRTENLTSQPEAIDANYPPTAYGQVVKTVSGLCRIIASGDAAADVKGFTIRPYPSQEYSANEALGAGTPDPTKTIDVMKRGYMCVLFKGTTAAKGGQVNVCINTAGGGAIGDITETTDSNNVAIANCFFMGAADSNGIVEISYNVER